MSAASQVAAQLAQVARQLQGPGGGGDGGGGDDRPLDGGLPDDGVLIALADVATSWAGATATGIPCAGLVAFRSS